MNSKRFVFMALVAGAALAALLMGAFTHSHAAPALPPETYYQGTEVTALTGEDDAYKCDIDIGFTFNYYGTDYTQLCASTNGFVTFDALGSSYYTNQPLTSTTGSPTTLIAPYWADLMSHNSQEMVLTGTVGSAPDREFVIQWTNFGFFNDNTPLGTFQIILYETSNNVRFQYRKMVHPDKGFGKIGTVGLRNSATQYTQHAYNSGTATLSDGQSLLFTWNSGASSYDLDPDAAYEGILFYKDTPPPALPQLTSPADGGDARRQPTFSWESAERTVTYTLKVANEADTSFSAPLINTDVLSPTTSYTHAGAPLTEGNTYLWTVTAANAEGDSWSDVWTFTATDKTTSTISVSGSPNPSNEGQEVTLTASVTPVTATGTVDFYADGALLGSGALSGGAATYATDVLLAGSHAITATYGGDANLFGSTSAVYTQMVEGAASGVHPVRDINQVTQDSQPWWWGGYGYGYRQGVVIGGVYYFAASDARGTELWKSDGTAGGTVLVKDIYPGSNEYGPNSSSPANLTDVNGALYFTADDGTNGTELWKSDGTAGGTVMVKDIHTGADAYGRPNSSSPANLTVVNGVLYFTANDGTNGQELWKSDGTAGGTVLVKDINPGSGSSSPSYLTALNGALYFAADDGTNGNELWKSDGTAGGTVMVKDIKPGGGWSGSSNPRYLTDVNGVLYFAADDGTNGRELWKSDGTADGTVLVKDIYTGTSYGRPNSSSPANLTDMNGLLYFTAYDGTNGQELWKSDGTGTGTVLVKNIRSGSGSSSPQYLSTVNSALYFSADDGTNGAELWKSDGTSGGTVLVKDVYTGTNSSNPSYLTDVNGVLYFTADDGTDGAELWKSDGTADGTVLVKDIVPSAWGWDDFEGGEGGWMSNLVNVNGALYFTANDGPHGYELWKSDGTTDGTVMIKDINTLTHHARPSYLTDVDGEIYFSAYDGVNGWELWKSDGTEGGTVLVKDIYPGVRDPSDDDYHHYMQGPNSSYPDDLTAVNGVLYFRADDGTNGGELWKSDGTEGGTVLVKDIYPGSSGDYTYSSYPRNLTVMNGVLYFTANDGTNGEELWKSNGTAGGTVLVRDIRSGSYGSYPRNLTVMNGVLYFRANDGTNGTELWKSDGTSGGTVLVKDIRSGSGSSYPDDLIDVNGVLYFRANDGTNGTELWKSDGTADGTVMVKDILSGSGSAYPRYLTDVNGVLYFQANDGTNGTELWKSDGAADGTVLVKDINPGTGHSSPQNMTAVNNVLYFVADDGTNGRELWKSDGAADGTVLVKDIKPGDGWSGSSRPASLTDVNGVLYFSADDGVNGRELWQSDGTADGTVMVQDLYPGAPSSFYEWHGYGGIVNINGALIFVADDGAIGYELWTYTPGLQLSFAKSVAPAAARPGQAVTFTLAFHNPSTISATHVTITDTLPAGFNASGVNSAGAHVTQTSTSPYVWQVQNLLQGEGGVITITGALADPLSPGKLTNVALLGAADMTRRSAAAQITVLKPQATIVLSNLSHTYDGAPKSATATTDPPGLSVALTYNGGSMPPVKPGSYTVVATVTDPDYEGSATATLVIGKGAAQVTLQDLARAYNGAPQKAGYATTPADQYAALTYEGASDAPANAGSYTVVATVDTELYAGVATDTLVIAKAPLAVTADSLVKIVGTANPPLTWRASGFVGGDKSDVLSGAPALSTTADTASPTGTYTITIAAGTLAAANYDLTTFVDGVLTITPKWVPEITWDNPSPIVYGAALGATQLNATASYEGENVPGAFVYTPASGAVLGGGEQTLTAIFTPDDTDTYATVPARATLLVKRASLTVRADDKSKTYGAANPALTVSYSGWIGSDGVSNLTALPTAETTATAATGAGMYPIVPSGGASDDYALHYVNGALTINKVALTVTANDKTRAYGAANPAFDAAYTGFVNDDTDANLEIKPTFQTTATASSPVGVYAITPQAGESQNYTFGPLVEGELTITQAPLTVVADDAARTDVAPNPADPAWHYDGFRVGDTSDVLTGAPAFAFGIGDGSLGSPTPLGDYVITPTVGTLAATNYAFAFESGVLHVTDRTVPTITWIIADPLVYGAALGAAQLNATATYSQGAVAGAYTYEPGEGMVLEAGERSLLVTFVPNDLLTFYTATQRADLIVTKAGLAVVADDKARNYGDPNPPLTVSYGDFVGADSADDLLTPPTATTTATESTPQGVYAIVPGGGDDANYHFTCINGELTIGEGLATVSLPDLARTYDGQPQVVTPTTSPAGLNVNVTYNGDSAAPVNPGSYTVVGTIDDSNYTGVATGTLVINKGVAEITLQGLARVYNGEPRQARYTTDPAGQYAMLTYDGSTTPPKDAGSYTVVARIPDDNPLYTGATTGTLTIGKVTLTVSAHDKIKYVGTANPAFTWGAQGFVGGENSAVLSGQPALATNATLNSPVGAYPITITAGTLSAANYAFSFANGELEVTPKLVPAVTWNKPLPIVYGAPLSAAQLNATASYDGQPITGTFVYTPALGVVLDGGEQPLHALFVPDDGDTYARVPAATSIIVQRAPLTVTAEAKSRVYGAANPALTVSYSGWVGSDGLSRLKVKPTAETTATTATPAGVYAIVPSGGASNYYELLYVNGALTIDKAALTVIANDATRAYGAANPVFDARYTGFVAGDTAANLETPATGVTTATVSTSPGVYAIVPSGGASANYTFGPYVNGALTITKATLTVVADDQARNEANPNPSLTWHYEGFLAGDTAAVLMGSPSLTPGAGAGSPGDPTPLGDYPITITQGTLDSARYDFTFVNGNLTVVPRTVPTVTWATPAPIVYGTELSPEQLNAETSDISGTVEGAYTYVPPEWTQLDAGEHSLLVTFVPDDLSTYYTATKRVSLVVTKAPLTVTADDQARGYGMENPPLTMSYDGFVWPDEESSLDNPPTAATTATLTTPQGVYAIVPGGGDDANYALIYVDGVLTITAADPQVVLTSSPNPSYYRQPVEFTASFTTGMPSGTVTFYDNGGPGTAVLPGARELGTVTLVDNVATFITDTLSVGTHYILAVYSGDANNNPSTSAPYEQVVEMPTNVIAAEGSVKMGAVYVYRVVASNPNTTPLYSVVITGSVPAEAAYVSVVGGSRVASGGDYGNGYVTSGAISELAPGESYTLTWSAQPLSMSADMSTQAHISSINAQADVTLSIRVYRLILPVVYKNATP
jgi:uncharacterized repeat protein (TIGR01451 family)